MNKSLISILLVVFLAVISGCADTGSGGGTSSGGGTGSSGGTSSGNLSAIPVDETPIVLTKDTSSSGGGTESTEPKPVEITNPRKDAGQYYPILISTAMGLNGEVDLSDFDFGIVKGIAYETKFGSSSSNSNLVFGEKDVMMYDLTDVTPLKEEGKGTYYVWITSGYSMPSEGKLVIAFLTKAEAEEYIPNNDNIVLQPESDTKYNPKFLDNKIVDELNKLGALRQYTFTVK